MIKINSEKKMYIATIIFTIVLMALILVQNFVSFYRNAVAEAKALGQSCLTAETKQLEAYINKGMNTVTVASNTAQYMMDEGKTSEEIEKYLVNESSNFVTDIDENFTGIYGVIGDDYVDGIGWVPDADYVPTERDWYKLAVAAGGKPAIVPPYVDAQTGDVIISLSRMLKDGKSVLSLDIVLNNVQEITSNINLNDRGYGFIMTNSGLIVAHFDQKEKGKNYLEDAQTEGFAKEILQKENRTFFYKVNDEDSTIFTNTIFDDWHVVMVVSDSKLLSDFRIVLIRDIVISVFLIIIIIFFYSFTFRKMNTLLLREEENTEKIERMNNNIVKSLAHTIDAKDRYTSGHSQRVAEYSLEIAKRAGKTEMEQRNIYYAGLLHDVGKIRVPEDVINKPGKLTEQEFGQIKLHPIASYHILKDIYEDKIIADGARFHHERYDGGGYPNGLKGNSIPEAARIIGVADAYDAMTSNRSYRKAIPQKVVYEEIEKGMGKQFDPTFAQIMLDMMSEDKEYKMKESESADKHILVVDDDVTVHELIEAFMQDIPIYKIQYVLSGEEALQVLEKSQIDLVLLDVILPGMDGIQTLRKIREKFEVPVVFLTGDKNEETIAAITQAGTEDYITKPFMPAILQEVIHSVLNM